MADASTSGTVSPELHRIAETARERPEFAFFSLNQYLTTGLLREAYRRTRKGGATGVDGRSADQYAEDLEGNLQRLLDRAKSGTYRAPPVRRVFIPKGRGDELRPLGIPTFEDKVLQRAVVLILEAIYEQDFRPCSYGFRPGRSAHQALAGLWEGLRRRGGWVLEVDIRKFFDSVDHGHLRGILRHRVRDGVILRLIAKWLHAGVMEEGQVHYPDRGTPQGGVISPLLANIFLHEVLDVWWEKEVVPRLSAEARLYRYADDFVMVFQSEADAKRVMAVLPKRFGKYGLTLHPTKTRLVPFVRPPDGGEPPDGTGTFDLLGFTHFWGKSREGNWVVRRKTARSRLARALHAINVWCRDHRHWKVAEQKAALYPKLLGHYAYYGLIGNYPALSRFHARVLRVWRFWLSRRSGRARLTWEAFRSLLRKHRLPLPRLRAASLRA